MSSCVKCTRRGGGWKSLAHYRKLSMRFSAINDSLLTVFYIALAYVAMKYMATQVFDRELKKGSAELLILSLIENRARHGYEISKLIEERSDGVLKFNVASFYPLLYRLEQRGLIAGRWVERAGQRRRRYYRLTAQGKDVLKTQRSTWLDFVNAIHRIT